MADIIYSFVKRCLKRIGIGTAVAFLLFGAWLSAEHFRGNVALHRRIQELQQRNEQLSIAALAPQRPSPDQNACAGLVALTNQLELVWSNLDNLPPTRFAAPGRAFVVWQLSDWDFYGQTNDWNKVKVAREQAETLLRLIHTAVQKPQFENQFDYHKGFADFQLGPLVPIKRAAQVLDAAMLCDLNQGRMEQAHQHLYSLIKLSADQTPEPLVICQLVRLACASIAFDATWQSLQAPGWSDSQLASLQTAWEQCNFSRDMGSAFEMERALDLDFFRQITESPQKLASVIGMYAEYDNAGAGSLVPFATRGFVLNWIHVPLWRTAWADQDALRLLNRWQGIIERHRFAVSNSWSAVSARLGSNNSEDSFPWFDSKVKPGWCTRFRFPFSSGIFGVSDTTIRRALRAQTQQQMVITALALARFQLIHSSFPPEMGSLVPTYLRSLPRDYMDGKPLRYRVAGRGESYLLYSVGDDGKDDNGDSSLESGKGHYGQIWDGKDAVWPCAATPDDAAAGWKNRK